MSDFRNTNAAPHPAEPTWRGALPRHASRRRPGGAGRAEDRQAVELLAEIAALVDAGAVLPLHDGAELRFAAIGWSDVRRVASGAGDLDGGGRSGPING